MKGQNLLPRLSRFTSDSSGVSPVIATIMTVMIVVMVSAIAYVWFASFTDQSGDTVIQPLSLTPDLNIERVSDELKLKIIVGERIEWDNYRVMVDNKEVSTIPGKVCYAGDTVYFDYPAGDLVAEEYYQLEIVDMKAKAVVYSEKVKAISSTPSGTGIYGYITASDSGAPLYHAYVAIYKSGQLATITTTDHSGAYRIEYREGEYDVVCEVNGSDPETSGMNYAVNVGNVTVAKNEMKRYNAALGPGTTQTATLQGRVYDNSTNTPIHHVKVKITDNEFFKKKKKTDVNGFYQFDLNPVTVDIIIEHNGYTRYERQVTIAASEAKTVDIYIDPIPLRLAAVHGSVYDNSTGSEMIGKKVYAENIYETNKTKTNVDGYYHINVVPGDVKIYVDLPNYEYFEITITLVPNEDRQIDIYLDKV